MTHPRYRSRTWRIVRRAVLDRDGHECQLRLARCTGRATAVDHIVRPEQGGADYDPANLRATCSSCNTSKRNRELAERARRYERGTPGLRAW